MIRDSKQLQIGKAGEYLVCADLIIKGFIAFPSEQGLPYDVLLDTGKRLLKIQVKTTEKPRKVAQRAKTSMAYVFNIKRAGKSGKTRYEINEIDIFALVCLDTMDISYLKNVEMPCTLNLRVDSMLGSYYDEKGISDYKEAIELRGSMSQTDIAKKLGIHVAVVNRMFKDGHIPHKTKAKYFSDLKRDKSWFYDI